MHVGKEHDGFRAAHRLYHLHPHRDEESLPIARRLLDVARTPAAMAQLSPEEIDRLLVPFGKHICTGQLPRCSTCPLLAMCRQVGVEWYR